MKEEDFYILSELGVSKIDILNKNFDKEKFKKIKKSKIPVTKIFKRKAFWNRFFYTDLNTLDPRQETELIIEIILKYFNKDEKILFYEMGVGTGCLIISLLNEFQNSKGIGIDISNKALNIAKINNNTNRLTLYKRDMKKDINLINFNGLKILISNPPYLTFSEIKNLKDPFISLYGGFDGLNYYRYLKKHMKHFDYCIFEIDPNRLKDIKKLFPTGIIYKDLLNLERVIFIKN